jgi:hypothetical protein
MGLPQPMANFEEQAQLLAMTSLYSKANQAAVRVPKFFSF